MNRDNHEYKETPSAVIGNANADGAAHRGWFIGQFLEEKYGLRSTSVIEVKWGKHHAGEERSVWGRSEKATTLCVLFKGKVHIRFPQQECLLSHEGDYVIWSAGIPHRWTMLEDTIMLTLRWPSSPEDYEEQVQISSDDNFSRNQLDDQDE